MKRRCSVRRALATVAILISSAHALVHATDCKVLQQNSFAGRAKVFIRQPGAYCLESDLNARTDVPGAHHSPEISQITIEASDVDLDLRGHAIGRGVFFKDPGGVGIDIADGLGPRLKNITIRNGILRDFDVGIRRNIYNLPSEFDSAGNMTSEAKRYTVDPTVSGGKIYYQKENITILGVQFERCKKDTLVTDYYLVPKR